MQSSHHDVKMIQKLPEIAILFFIGKAIPYVLRMNVMAVTIFTFKSIPNTFYKNVNIFLQ